MQAAQDRERFKSYILETSAVESRRDKTSGVAEIWREARWRETAT